MTQEMMLADDRTDEAQGYMEVAMTRAAQEVQAAMVIAKKFPRDEQRSIQRIRQACKRKALAEAAVYEYPRGKGNIVSGPSIRLAEVLAQQWGNIDSGVIELEQRKGNLGKTESVMMAYAWDLETNARSTKVFTVSHWRSTREGGYLLSDPRDIYELTANQGSRRLRSCILGIIPGDVVDVAVEECEKTMSGANPEPLSQRIQSMVSVFEKLGVGVPEIEGRVGHKLGEITERELSSLRKVYLALKDNMGRIDEYFPAKKETDKAAAFIKKINKTAAPAPDESPADPPIDSDVQPEAPAPAQADPPHAEPESQEPHPLEDYDTFTAALEQEIRGRGATEEQAKKLIGAMELKHGCKGKPGKLKLEKRREILDAAKAGKAIV